MLAVGWQRGMADAAATLGAPPRPLLAHPLPGDADAMGADAPLGADDAMEEEGGPAGDAIPMDTAQDGAGGDGNNERSLSNGGGGPVPSGGQHAAAHHQQQQHQGRQHHDQQHGWGLDNPDQQQRRQHGNGPMQVGAAGRLIVSVRLSTLVLLGTRSLDIVLWLVGNLQYALRGRSSCHACQREAHGGADTWLHQLLHPVWSAQTTNSPALGALSPCPCRMTRAVAAA